MSAGEDTRRPSHEHLMAAQEALGKAREVEKEAGNLAVSQFLNELVLTVFTVAIRDDIDDALAAREQAGAAQ